MESDAAPAIRRLDAEREPISFKAVAARAGVSRQWLYTQPDLRSEIERLRHADGRPPLPASEQASRASLRERIAHLLDENRRLRTEIADLKAELAVAHGRQRHAAAGPSTSFP